jgi:hypothetical protein
MKKFIATAIAAGAMVAGGAASAQDLGSIIAGVLGFGQPQYSYGQPHYGYGQPQYSYGGPAVVAGAQQMYIDQYGRTFYYDQWGRQVFVQGAQQQQQQIVGYDQWGRPVYGTSGQYAYGNRSWDRDGDGVSNSRDRWPDDRRYW